MGDLVKLTSNKIKKNSKNELVWVQEFTSFMIYNVILIAAEVFADK